MRWITVMGPLVGEDRGDGGDGGVHSWGMVYDGEDWDASNIMMGYPIIQEEGDLAIA